MLGAEMRSARVLARDRRGGDRAADANQALQVHPVVPGQVEGPIMVAQAACIEFRFEAGQFAPRVLEAWTVADDPDLFPHHVVEPLPNRLEASRSSFFERRFACGHGRVDRIGIRSLETSGTDPPLSLIHISEPTRLLSISYAVFCL